jgi:ABC-type transporter Mla maintaining outer membrane lipid asymmetry permease subunit MlaE
MTNPFPVLVGDRPQSPRLLAGCISLWLLAMAVAVAGGLGWLIDRAAALIP